MDELRLFYHKIPATEAIRLLAHHLHSDEPLEQSGVLDRIFTRLRQEQIKGYGRFFSRFDKLDVMFTDFIHVALIFDALRLC